MGSVCVAVLLALTCAGGVASQDLNPGVLPEYSFPQAFGVPAFSLEVDPIVGGPALDCGATCPPQDCVLSVSGRPVCVEHIPFDALFPAQSDDSAATGAADR